MKNFIFLSITLVWFSSLLFAGEINTMHLIYTRETTDNGLAKAFTELGADANTIEAGRYSITREELWWDGSMTKLVKNSGDTNQSQVILSDDKNTLVYLVNLNRCFLEDFPLRVALQLKHLLRSGNYVSRQYDPNGVLEREEMITIERVELNLNFPADCFKITFVVPTIIDESEKTVIGSVDINSIADLVQSNLSSNYQDADQSQ